MFQGHILSPKKLGYDLKFKPKTQVKEEKSEKVKNFG